MIKTKVVEFGIMVYIQSFKTNKGQKNPKKIFYQNDKEKTFFENS